VILRATSRRPAAPERSDITLSRRRLLTAGGVSLGVLATGGLFNHRYRAVASPFIRQSGTAAASVEVQILQTAASLEHVVIATYASALELPFIRNHAPLRQFVETTMQHHVEHGEAFNARVEALGGERQTAPNTTYASVVEQASPLRDVTAVVRLAAILEEVATDTYLADLAQLHDLDTRSLTASVMGVEAQHLATLRAFDNLFSASLPDLVATPTDLPRLPRSIGSAACPRAFELPDRASPPAEGALP
jgi:Ferritin-like domain